LFAEDANGLVSEEGAPDSLGGDVEAIGFEMAAELGCRQEPLRSCTPTAGTRQGRSTVGVIVGGRKVNRREGGYGDGRIRGRGYGERIREDTGTQLGEDTGTQLAKTNCLCELRPRIRLLGYGTADGPAQPAIYRRRGGPPFVAWG
jgi:hypothetical protein